MTTGLSVIRPLVISPAMLVSSNVAENDHPEWDSEATYATGDRVIVAAQHKVYRSAIDANTGKNPVTDKAAWQLVGATNRWKPFDTSITSQVVQADSIVYRLKPGKVITSLAILNVAGAVTVRVRQIDPVFGEVYDKTINMARIPIRSGWWAWFFGERRTPTQLILQDLKAYPTADLLIEITGGSALAAGVILVGQLRTFAMGVRQGVGVGINDFSRKEKNEFGDTVLVERPFSRRLNFSMLLRNSEVDEADRFFGEVRATLCLWIVSKRYEATLAYGFYKSFEILLAYDKYSDCNLEVEGIT